MSVPSVSIITQPFEEDAKASSAEEGMNLRIVYTSQPIDHTGPTAVKMAGLMIDKIVQGLTAPLTESEKSPQPKEIEKLPRLVFKGDLEEVNRFFYSRHWTDGLPIIPPTEDSVKEMLTGTSHSPEEILGIMPPESWRTTVEGVAINGVMAGCKPKHMPVLLAQIEAFLTEPMYYSFVRSAGSFGFMQVVNGPIADEIGMNCENNALGPGSSVNLSIGRAFRMCIINQGGSLPGVNLMASQGNVIARGLAFAENEKASPWQPYHVERGFKAEESILTMFGGEGGFSNPGSTEIIKYLRNDKHRSASVILLDPLLAKLFVEREGFTEKSAFKAWLWKNTRLSIKEWRDSYFYEADMKPLVGKPGWWPNKYSDPSTPLKTLVPVFPNPDCLHIIVVGGSVDPVCQIFEMRQPCSVSIDRWR